MHTDRVMTACRKNSVITMKIASGERREISSLWAGTE